jgi:glycosyltransferase involved in cell wall biosynthesis
MQVSVVICTHTMDRYDALAEAATSVLRGSYEDVELVLVSDGNEAVAERMRADFGEREDVVVHCLPENSGLLAARNAGAAHASGDVVAFLDDDALADEQWLARLVAAYEAGDHVAVGGKMVPAWVAGEPAFLPAEFHWLIGVTHRGFRENEGEVRNTFGSNISFRREAFEALGGFDTNVGGRKGDKHLQGGETELCARLAAEFDQGVHYVPDAEVAHKIYAYRTDPKWLVRRAFWQGYSKRGMEKFVPESTGEEGEFLGRLLTEFVPDRLAGLLGGPSRAKLQQLSFLFVLTAAVGLGYGYGLLKWR